MDLAAATEFDLAAARRNIQSVRPGMHVLEVSSKTGQGMDEALSFLQSQLEASRATLEHK
jgi:hydrogenase nickel incorporation protein HypB